MQMNELFYGGSEPHWQRNGGHQRPSDYRVDSDYATTGRTFPTYEFRVPMCCPKCEEKVREELAELVGVYEIFADQVTERVAVTGFVDPFEALKKMKRIKKKSQFWDGSATLKSSSHGQSSDKKSFLHSHKKPHSRHETVYRASPSQVSSNREPSRRVSSRSLPFRNKYGSYDDEISYSDLRPESAYRNKNYSSYDDDVSYSYQRPSSAFRNKHYGSYDDDVSYSHQRPSSAIRNKHYGSYDDDVSYSHQRPSSAIRSKYYGAYDDNISYSDLRSSSAYRNIHGASSPDSRPPSSLFSCLPRSRSLRYESAPPFAQEYYTEEPVEMYPNYAHY